MAELVPGISGGTVALVVGVYERALDAGMEIIGLIKALFTDRDSVPARLRRLDWFLLVSAFVAMVLAVFLMADLLSTFVSDYTEIARSLFLGMVLVSIAVPCFRQ